MSDGNHSPQAPRASAAPVPLTPCPSMPGWPPRPPQGPPVPGWLLCAPPRAPQCRWKPRRPQAPQRPAGSPVPLRAPQCLAGRSVPPEALRASSVPEPPPPGPPVPRPWSLHSSNTSCVTGRVCAERGPASGGLHRCPAPGSSLHTPPRPLSLLPLRRCIPGPGKAPCPCVFLRRLTTHSGHSEIHGAWNLSVWTSAWTGHVLRNHLLDGWTSDWVNRGGGGTAPSPRHVVMEML